MMTEHSPETKIAILEAKVEHMMGHVKELTLRVRANEKVVAIVSAIGIGAGGIVGTTAFAPRAEACSPPLDGSEFTCPPHDLVLEDRVKLPREQMKGDIDLYSINHWHHMQMMFQRNMQAGKMEQEMTQPEDALNNALNDFWNEQNGSNDTTLTQELL
tara:strand:- start:208 stop:681 length:474 start_codon:yes stop_codon:yes gene_type:complete